MRNIVFCLTLIICVGPSLTSADQLYQCNGVYQNSPCTTQGESKALTDLPKVSHYDGKKAIIPAPANQDEARARPRTEILDENMITESDEKLDVGPQVIEKETMNLRWNAGSYKDLEKMTSELKAELDKRAINAADAQSKSIRLRVLHDTLCGKIDQVKAANARAECDRSEDNLQAVTLKIRNKLQPNG